MARLTKAEREAAEQAQREKINARIAHEKQRAAWCRRDAHENARALSLASNMLQLGRDIETMFAQLGCGAMPKHPATWRPWDLLAYSIDYPEGVGVRLYIRHTYSTADKRVVFQPDIDISCVGTGALTVSAALARGAVLTDVSVRCAIIERRMREIANAANYWTACSSPEATDARADALFRVFAIAYAETFLQDSDAP